MKRTRTRSELYVAVATAIGAGITLSAVSSAWAQQIAQSRERIEVTGTNIKRVDTETVAPVEIITRDQIERSGQATVGEMLRRIPSATELGDLAELWLRFHSFHTYGLWMARGSAGSWPDIVGRLRTRLEAYAHWADRRSSQCRLVARMCLEVRVRREV